MKHKIEYYLEIAFEIAHFIKLRKFFDLVKLSLRPEEHNEVDMAPS